MRIDNRIATQAPVAFGYHATTVDALPSIAREGLLPNDGSRGFWPNEYDVMGKLFVCDDLDAVTYYAETIEQAVGPAAILRFPLPSGLVTDSMTDGGGGWWTDAPIKTSFMEVLDGERWEPIDRGSAP